MKIIAIALFTFLITSCTLAQAQEVTIFEWDAPTTTIDGTPITGTISYKMYCDTTITLTTLGVEVGTGLTTPISITGADDIYRCAFTAYDGVNPETESPLSNEVIVIKQNGKYYTGGTLNAPVLRVK